MNPEAKKAEVRYSPLPEIGKETRIASVSEITGFLGEEITFTLVVYSHNVILKN